MLFGSLPAIAISLASRPPIEVNALSLLFQHTIGSVNSCIKKPRYSKDIDVIRTSIMNKAFFNQMKQKELLHDLEAKSGCRREY